MNKNDVPLKKISEANLIYFKNFEHRSYFKKIFSLKPNRDNEKLEIVNVLNDSYINKKGLVYCFVVEEIIFKIGSSTTNMKGRIQSYNCGKQSYRNSGTCSTTNYFVLQTFLNINKVIDVYAYFPEVIEFDVFGKKEKSSLPAKYYEKAILTNMKNEGVFPSLCTQT